MWWLRAASIRGIGIIHTLLFVELLTQVAHGSERRLSGERFEPFRCEILVVFRQHLNQDMQGTVCDVWYMPANCAARKFLGRIRFALPWRI